MNFGNGDTEFPVPNSTARVHGMLEVKRKKKFDKLIIAEIGENKNCNNCGNDIAENREKKKILWEPNYGNVIAEIGE